MWCEADPVRGPVANSFRNYQIRAPPHIICVVVSGITATVRSISRNQTTLSKLRTHIEMKVENVRATGHQELMRRRQAQAVHNNAWKAADVKIQQWTKRMLTQGL